MHIKHMREMIEKLTDCTKSAIENDEVCVGKYPISDVVDMIKDLNEASYYASIVKAMDEAKKEDEEEEKYMMKRFKEEYGEEDGEKRFYDEWRYKSTGRYAPKGRGTRVGRRGYVEPPYYHMMPEMYDDYNAEEMRDLDRHKGRMYFSQPMGNMGSGKSDGGNYSDGYNDGQTRGYSEGYEKGMNDGRRSGGNSRYDSAKRGYQETKEMHKGNTPEDNKENMRGLEELLGVVGEDIKEISPKMSPSEKAMTAQKLDTWSKMLKQ